MRPPFPTLATTLLIACVPLGPQTDGGQGAGTAAGGNAGSGGAGAGEGGGDGGGNAGTSGGGSAGASGGGSAGASGGGSAGASGGGSAGASGGGSAGANGGGSAGGQGGGAPLARVSFTDTFPFWDRIPGACTVGGGGIEGREPDAPGRYPVFVYLVGTGDNYQSELALLEIERMASLGYVAASLNYGQDVISTLYDIDYLNHGHSAPALLRGKTQCAFGPVENSAISKLCARPKADCSKGIVTSGHSQGSMVASLAKNHDWRVNATVAYATGYSTGLNAGFFALSLSVSDLFLNGARALPNDRVRAVNGQSEWVIGGPFDADAGVHVPGPAPQLQMKQVTGMDCGAATGACFRSNGSGYYYLADAETTSGLAGHCFMGAGDGGDCSAGPLDPGFTQGSAPWALPAHLAWLDGFKIQSSGLDEGLVANWRFDSSSGSTALDSDDLAHNAGTITQPTWAPGAKGNALQFSAGSTVVDIAADPSLTLADSFSTSLWVRPVAAGGSAQMLLTHAAGTAGSHYLQLNSTLTLEFKIGPWWAPTYVTTRALNPGQWSHVAVVYRRASGSVTVSINGVPQTWSGAAAPSPSPGPTRLGKDSTGGRAFTGVLDEVRIYNRALSSTEVDALYNGGSPNL